MHEFDPPNKVLLNPRTAPAALSIWRDLSEDVFRTHLVQLEEQTNGIPCEPKTFAFKIRHEDDQHVLPVAVERQLADDFAFLAAAEEGAQSVTACCIEEHTNAGGMTVRFAVTDSIYGPPKEGLRLVFGRLSLWATHESRLEVVRRDQASRLYQDIIQFHQQRIVSRLRSKKWQKPKYLSESHKKPLWKDFENVIHRTQFLYTKKESIAKRAIQGKLQDLATVYETFETTRGSATDHLITLVHETFNVCISLEMKTFVQKLESVGVTAQVASALKCVRQIEKIGGYYRISHSLMNTAKEYPSLFSNIQAEYLNPYSSIPTSISFEAWAKTCHVHAEVQLAVQYSLPRSETNCNSISRVIGTSKYMCFLCYLFIDKHGLFQASNTHGRLYDQWTIPDIVEFSEEQQQRFRGIIQDMDDVVVEWSKREPKWRAEPMTSRQNLVDSGIEVDGLIDIPLPRHEEEANALPASVEEGLSRLLRH